MWGTAGKAETGAEYVTGIDFVVNQPTDILRVGKRSRHHDNDKSTFRLKPQMNNHCIQASIIGYGATTINMKEGKANKTKVLRKTETGRMLDIRDTSATALACLRHHKH